ncbi:hypothetical protein CES85_2353 [Ochrobactrum quorumnocens]|uniref:Uncharacterized protein n=1 Tax=Ochrobactrum quorumnocens TaxID=271865 RepID=A0A248UK16_9HYPH|nr:hypothetical protein CES85_2353 [[Ochrobactrum] quorumnocens]
MEQHRVAVSAVEGAIQTICEKACAVFAFAFTTGSGGRSEH